MVDPIRRPGMTQEEIVAAEKLRARWRRAHKKVSGYFLHEAVEDALHATGQINLGQGDALLDLVEQENGTVVPVVRRSEETVQLTDIGDEQTKSASSKDAGGMPGVPGVMPPSPAATVIRPDSASEISEAAKTKTTLTLLFAEWQLDPAELPSLELLYSMISSTGATVQQLANAAFANSFQSSFVVFGEEGDIWTFTQEPKMGSVHVSVSVNDKLFSGECYLVLQNQSPVRLDMPTFLLSADTLRKMAARGGQFVLHG